MNLTHTGLFLALSIASGSQSHAATLSVPSQHATIQAAILNAKSGDEILVSPGTYSGGLDFLGKDLVLRSTSGPEVTILDGGMTQRILACFAGEYAEVIGFTFQNGFIADSFGGSAILSFDGHLGLSNCIFTENRALRCGSTVIVSPEHGGSPTAEMKDCRFVSNTATNAGGMSIHGTTVLSAERCVFEKNMATGNFFFPGTGSGGAFTMSEGTSATFLDCEFIENQSLPPYGVGGALRVGGNAQLQMRRCRIAGNIAADGGGFLDMSGGNVEVVDSEIIGNVAAFGSVARTISTPTLTFRGCTLSDHATTLLERFPGAGTPSFRLESSIAWGNAGALDSTGAPAAVEWSNVQVPTQGIGNTSVDPQFVNPASGNYSLKSNSPCIDAGDPSTLSLDTTLAADPRWIDGDLDGTRRVDMGADEWNPIQVEGENTFSGVTIHLSGAPGLQTFLIAGFPGETPVPGVGTLFISLATPIVLTPWASAPSSVPVLLPGPPPTPIHLHAIAVLGSQIFLSNVVAVDP